MSQMKMFHAMERMMEQEVEEAVRATFREGRSAGDAADDVDAFVHSLLVRLGLRTPGELLRLFKSEDMPPLEKAPINASDSESGSVKSGATGGDKDNRKRTVSKKMKETFLAMPGGTEDSLKAAMRVYKAADQARIDGWGGKWDSFARAFLAGECTPAKKVRAKAAPKADAAPGAPKKEKVKVERNFTWTPTAKKLFAETVEGGGGKVTDALKEEFAAQVNAKTADDYKVLAPVGHMRAFVASKGADAAPPAPADDVEDVDDDDEEDLEEIEIAGETLTIGVKSGKIYRATEDSGDVQIGVAGQGKFKDVKIPSA
jgi:hypothetical protein